MTALIGKSSFARASASVLKFFLNILESDRARFGLLTAATVRADEGHGGGGRTLHLDALDLHA